MLVLAAATALSLRPRPTRGPRAGPTFVLASAANELPFFILYWLVADTALAATQRDIASPLGWTGLAIAVGTFAGSIAVIAQAAKAGRVLDGALASGLGDDWRTVVESASPGPRGAHHVLRRVLVAPLRIPSRVVRRQRDVAYGPAGRENELDVYRPRSRAVGCPVLVYFHPGGFFSGRKSRESRALFDRLVTAGWVCISANYRLGPAGAFPKNLVDAKQVIAWVRAHATEYGADPSTLVVCGGSAGAHLSAVCALTSDDPTFQPGFEQADTSVSAAVSLYGYYGPALSSEYTPAAPGAYARADAPPFLVIHGTNDPMIAPVHARQFVEQLRSTSTRPVLYAELPGGQHNFDRFPSIRCFAVVDAIEAFATWVRSGSAP